MTEGTPQKSLATRAEWPLSIVQTVNRRQDANALIGKVIRPYILLAEVAAESVLHPEVAGLQRDGCIRG